MDKKKLLIIAISIGFFLVIVVGFAILVFSPRSVPAAVSPALSGTTPSSSPPRSAGTTTPAQPGILDTTVYDADTSNEIPDNQTQPDGSVLISVPSPRAPGVPSSAPTGSASSQTSTLIPATTPEPAPVLRPASVAPAVTKPVQTPAPVVKPKVLDNYWIQAGSFSTLNRAEGAKELLMIKGFIPIIESHDVQGSTVFRVRVGPYTSQTEANYWLPIIKAISGFEDSLVWKTQTQQS